MTLRWNLADLFELVAETVPDRLARGARYERASRGAGASSTRAPTRSPATSRAATRTGDKLAVYSDNRPEFVEALVGAMKARLVPVNVNYRYREDELVYLFDNSDASAVIYEAAFADRVAKIRDRLPQVREWIELADAEARGGNAFATPYEETTRRRRARASTSSAAPTTWSSSTPAAPPACRRA